MGTYDRNKSTVFYWFETGSDKEMKLVHSNGSSLINNDWIDGENEQWNHGWQRATLFMEEMKIWDATAFGASMNIYFLYHLRKEFEGESIPKYIILTTPQFAEEVMFKGGVEPADTFTSR